MAEHYTSYRGIAECCLECQAQTVKARQKVKHGTEVRCSGPEQTDLLRQPSSPSLDFVPIAGLRLVIALGLNSLC